MDNKGNWGLTKNIWDTIEKNFQQYKGSYPDLIIRTDRKSKFSELYKKRYQDTMDRFMVEETTALDSHKQAALLTICCLESNIIEHPLDNDDEISIIPQIIAINAGLSFMLRCLNNLLEKKKIKKQIEQYYFPVAIACDTPYLEIMCRILYHEQHEQDMDFNVLELADRFFLIEYINLLQHGIEPALLKETK